VCLPGFLYFYFVNFLLKLLPVVTWKISCGFYSSFVILFSRVTYISLSEHTLGCTQLRKFSQISFAINFDVYFVVLFNLLCMKSSNFVLYYVLPSVF
jgi:hypothetical protein